ncbi:hypothetical protein [Breoghania sp. L-A4]|uniref:hypothetical protein n=1 Tax=Breoghania sp. L-A4 TaxID=2304600 RepID=UPI0013C37ACA|nr:hypothetical protein [Breoghania sp. L-A4]
MSSQSSTILTPSQICAFGAGYVKVTENIGARDRFTSEILHSILFNGPISVDAPSDFLENLGLSQFIEEGLLFPRQLSYADPTIKRLTAAYDMAWNGYRKLEEHPKHAPVVPYEYIGKKIIYDEVELSAIYSDIEFGVAQIEQTINPIVKGLFEIFGYHFIQSIEMFHSIAQGVLRDRGVLEISLEELYSNDIWRDLGLYIQSPEQTQKEFSDLPFTPNDLREVSQDFWSLYSEVRGFEDYLTSFFQVTMNPNPASNIRTRTYFKTIFDLHNAMKFAQDGRGVLFLPFDTEADDEDDQEIISINPDLVRTYKLYLSERNLIPRIQRIEDVLRLREDKGLKPLIENLKIWNELEIEGDNKVIEQIRNDIDAATRELKWISTEKTVGQVVGWASLPVGLVDMLLMTPFSLIAGGVGVAIDRDAARRAGKMKWLSFGCDS